MARNRLGISWFSVFVCYILWVAPPVLSAVLAIDYGTENYKAALVKPGIPFEIVLTKDSKRKDPSAIGFKRQERVYGSDAVGLSARFPQDMFLSLKPLLGVKFNDPVCHHYARSFPATEMVPTPRDTVALRLSSGEVYSVEELVAMQLQAAKSQAESMAGESIRDSVITVPFDFDDDQRLAMMTSAQLAGLNVLTLINDGLATAVNYATSRQFQPEPQYHIFFDVGASSSSATLTSLRAISVPDYGKFNKTVTEVSVLGVSTHHIFSGNQLTDGIVKHLATEFQKKHSKDLLTDPKAHAKLIKESNRVKHILSANNEVTASIESVIDDLDLRIKIARSTFEEISAEARSHVLQPIKEAYSQAGLDKSEVESIVLAGAGVRVPFIQRELEDFLGKDKIAKSINPDESAVFGAIFQGSRLSNQFKTKNIRIADMLGHEYYAHLSGNVQKLFDAKSQTRSTKSLPLDAASDFEFHVSTTGREGDLIAKIQVSNLTNTINAMKAQPGCVEPAVSAEFSISDSSMLDVQGVKVSCEVEESKTFGDKIKGFFGGKSSSSSDSSSTTTSPVGTSTETTIYPETPITASSQSAAAPSTKAVKVTKEMSVPAAFVQFSKNLVKGDQFEEMAKKLKRLNLEDQSRVAREEMRNSLESYAYKIRDYVLDKDFVKVSTDTERDQLVQLASNVGEWLYSEGTLATLPEIKAKRSSLEDIEKPISARRFEMLFGPIELEKLETVVGAVGKLIESYDSDTIHAFDQSEIIDRKLDLQSILNKDVVASIEEKLNETKEWLQAKKVSQQSLKITEEPALKIADLKASRQSLEVFVRRLLTSTKPSKSSSKQSATPSTEPTSYSVTSSVNTSAEHTESSSATSSTSRPTSESKSISSPSTTRAQAQSASDTPYSSEASSPGHDEL